MIQFYTLIWLKWTLFRNSLRSSKAVANQVAMGLGMLAALVLALIVAVGLGFAAFALSLPNAMSDVFKQAATRDFPPSASLRPEFIFFSILAFIYLMWATVPLSIGSAKQFDVSKMLMYPISLKKLFAIDFLSEVTTLQSVFAIPAIVAMGIGAGIGSGRLMLSLLATIPATVFGIALSKWLSTIIGSLVRRKRSRGETILALVGAVAGLGGALAGQVAPILFRYAESVRTLRWTPPGAAAVIVMGGGGDLSAYALAYLTLGIYAFALIAGTFWVARRAALGLGGKKKRVTTTALATPESVYAGWNLPLLSPQLSAMVEKELRYAMRNAQLRMLAVMPLILIFVRLFNSRRINSELRPNGSGVAETFLAYGSGLMTTAGILYVFLILAGLSCNLFAFEESGMRTLILSPIERKKILIGKNLAVIVLALGFSVILLIINAIVFRDVTIENLLFTALSFVIFGAMMSIVGNWFSVRFPKRMKFGKRMNVSGVAGLLMIPLIVFLALPPVVAVMVGYLTGNLLFEYVTLAAFAAVSIGIYGLVIDSQGKSLARRELEILEVVKEPVDE